MAFTSNTGLGHLVQLPALARAELSEAYVAAFDAFGELVSTCFRLGPQDLSPAAQMIEAEGARARSVIVDVIDSVLFRCRAGLNHARMVATAINDSHSAFGVVTLTRGCLESFGAAWWILNATTGRELAVRGLVAQRKELGDHAKRRPGDQLVGVDGAPVGGAEDVLAEMDATLASLTKPGSTPPARPSFTELASELAEQVGPNGRLRYSVYSAVAHGELMGVANFLGVTTGTKRVHYTVGLPAWMADDCGTSVFSATSAVLRRLQGFLLGASRSDDRWAIAHDHALQVSKAVREQYANPIRRSMASYIASQYDAEQGHGTL